MIELAQASVDAGWMNREAFQLFTVVITPWKCVGYLGMLLFGGRWIVQWWASKKAGRVTMPSLFWYMSVSGSALLLSYFTFGKNDSVGIMSNLLPATVSCYNLYLDMKHRRRGARVESSAG